VRHLEKELALEQTTCRTCWLKRLCMIIRKLIITRFLSFNIVVQYNSDTMDF
jgi:hypothetical protein